jgi:hypothetical protein
MMSAIYGTKRPPHPPGKRDTTRVWSKTPLAERSVADLPGLLLMFGVDGGGPAGEQVEGIRAR